MAGSVDELEIDGQTGLPKLPSGYFFHFRKDSDGDVRCEVRKGPHLWFSKVISFDYVRAVRFDEDRMRILAREVAKTAYSRIGNVDDLKRLLGSYPPKSLRK